MPRAGKPVILVTGVYRIHNLLDGKIYVGSAAVSFEGRWKSHKNMLRANRHPNIHLQRAWNRDGEASFAFEVIESCTPNLCLEREQYWIDCSDATNDVVGYNILPTAGSVKGHIWRLSPEQLEVATERNKETAKKRDSNQEWKDRVAASNRARAKNSEEISRLQEMSVKAARIKKAGLSSRQSIFRTAQLIARNRSGLTKGRKSDKRKFTDTQVKEIRHRVINGESQAEVGKDFGIGQAQVSKIVNRGSYQDVV